MKARRVAAIALAICATATATAATSATATSATATATTAASRTAATTATTHIVVWSVNSDGAYFRTILTGGVGDYGPAVTVHPDGTVDPEHTSELELNLTRGSFRLSIGKLDSEFGRAFPHFRYDAATCSVTGAITGSAPVIKGSGTGAYRGIAGSFRLTISVDEVDTKKPGCDGTSSFLAQLLLFEGTGHLS